jgi:SNF family Na+-dependent transporter
MPYDFHVIGIYELQVTNAWSGTKLIMDPDFKEVKDYKTRSQFCTYIQYNIHLYVKF